MKKYINKYINKTSYTINISITFKENDHVLARQYYFEVIYIIKDCLRLTSQ